MREFELIERLKPLLPLNDSVVAGAGDDCAVLDLGSRDSLILFKTDAVVEGFHFTSETEPRRVGRKALARALSDVAAMGGTPVAALVTLGLADGKDPAWVELAYGGLCDLARQYGVAIVGGETTSLREGRMLSVSLVGRVHRGHVVRRSGARVGNAIFVTGELGGSIAGKHLDFDPRLEEGRWLAATGWVTSMMDVSDGLAGDLHHLLDAAGVGAELRGQSIPISRAARIRAREVPGARPAMVAALGDGEDFELLFTTEPLRAVALRDAFAEAFPKTQLTCIGRITRNPGLRLRDANGMQTLARSGFEHFGQ